MRLGKYESLVGRRPVMASAWWVWRGLYGFFTYEGKVFCGKGGVRPRRTSGADQGVALGAMLNGVPQCPLAPRGCAAGRAPFSESFDPGSGALKNCTHR